MYVCSHPLRSTRMQTQTRTFETSRRSLDRAPSLIKLIFVMVMARPTKEEQDFFKEMGREIPNIVTDVYKVRSGQWSQVRIWSYVDLGTLRKVDLYMTDSRMEVIDQYTKNFAYTIDWECTEFAEQLEELRKVK